MQSCLEYHPYHHPHQPQGGHSPHVTFRQYSGSPYRASSPPIKEEEGGATASPGSGGPAVSSGGGGFYGAQPCYLPAARKVGLGMLGMHSVNTPFYLLKRGRTVNPDQGGTGPYLGSTLSPTQTNSTLS